MTITKRIAITILAAWLLTGCPSGEEPNTRPAAWSDAGTPDAGWGTPPAPLAYPDAGPTPTPDQGGLPPAGDSGLFVDAMPAPDGALPPAPDSGPPPAALCQQLGGDGVPLNPGCDPDVQVNGLTAVAALPSTDAGATPGQTSWLAISGKKWWIYGPPAGGGPMTFTTSGADVAAFLQQLGPGCGAKTADNLELNPGCDPDVKANGLTSLSGHLTADGGAAWLAGSGKKWWAYNAPVGQPGAFTEGGRDVATWLRNFSPGCAATTSDGLSLNPGCDPDVKTKGLHAVAAHVVGGQLHYVASVGKKWWLFTNPNPATGVGAAFVSGGKDVTAYLQQLGPKSCNDLVNGIPLNAGCDPTMQVNGLTATAAVEIGGAVHWLMLSGKRWWWFENPQPATGVGAAFTNGGPDVSTFFKAFGAPTP